MLQKTEFYIGGKWQSPLIDKTIAIINPATELPFARVSLGSIEDVNRAVAAAKQAFIEWSQREAKERIHLLARLCEIYEKRAAEMAKTISMEMGAPITLATNAQAAVGLRHIKSFLCALNEFQWEGMMDGCVAREKIAHEPIGVCGLITPWNWPMNQVTLKVMPALGVGCTVVHKPSEIAPLSSILMAEMIHDAGFPPGVFNLVNGDGPTVGGALAAHPDVDMISFTGSTGAGISIQQLAAPTVKRVALELGGKSSNIVFADANLASAIQRGVAHCFQNCGQSCNAPTKMLVERPAYERAKEYAAKLASEVKVNNPENGGTHLGPLASEAQFIKVQALIAKGIDEGAPLIAGGLGKPDGFDRGYYVKPTIFADVNNRMTIAREEIFGPVLCMMPFDVEDEAIQLANDSPYGLAAYVQTADQARAQRIARKLRVGMVQLNGVPHADGSPFGGYKQSGNGREGGIWGLQDFLEIKAISGWSAHTH